MHVWRISKYTDLSGRGGLLLSGRWHEKGIPVVYCADHPSTALLEVLVHLDPEDIPPSIQLLKIICPDDMAVATVPDGWADLTDPDKTQAHGSDLLRKRGVCLISVPSAIMPAARNILINPLHPDAGRIAIEKVYDYPFDSRLLR